MRHGEVRRRVAELWRSVEPLDLFVEFSKQLTDSQFDARFTGR
jgi:hypothetical protein